MERPPPRPPLSHDPSPDPYDLGDRLTLVEAKLKAIERAVGQIFHKVNVNRIADPDVARFVEVLVELQASFDRLAHRPPPTLKRPSRMFTAGIEAEVSDELPAIDGGQRGTQVRLRAVDSDREIDVRAFSPADPKKPIRDDPRSTPNR